MAKADRVLNRWHDDGQMLYAITGFDGAPESKKLVGAISVRTKGILRIVSEKLIVHGSHSFVHIAGMRNAKALRVERGWAGVKVVAEYKGGGFLMVADYDVVGEEAGKVSPAKSHRKGC